MARKKREAVGQVAIEGMAAEPEAGQDGAPVAVEGIGAAAAEDAPRRAQKLQVTLTDDGRIDTGVMKPESRERLKKIIRATPELADEVKSKAPPMRVPEAAIGAIYSILGTIETVLMSRKYPVEICSVVFPFTAPEVHVLMGPTQDVLAKYAGSLSKYQEETTLALVLTQVHFQKMRRLEAMLAERAERARQPGPQPDVTQ